MRVLSYLYGLKMILNEKAIMKKVNILMAVACLALAACQPQGSEETDNVRVQADGIVASVAPRAAEVYSAMYPEVDVKCGLSAGEGAVDSLLSGAANVAITARPLTETETARLKEKGWAVRTELLGITAPAFVINGGNDCETLFTSELADLLSGKAAKWADLQPSKLGDVEVVADSLSMLLLKFVSDTVAAIPEGKVKLLPDSRAVTEYVAATPAAVGIVPVNAIAQVKRYAEMPAAELAKILINPTEPASADFLPGVKVIKLRRDGADKPDAYEPYLAYVLGDAYPIATPIYITTTATVGTQADKYFKFLLNNNTGQKLMLWNSIVPAVTYRDYQKSKQK